MKAADVLAQINRKPFRSFLIHLVDGETILIDLSDIVLHADRRPELLIVFTADGRMRLFEENMIASITEPEEIAEEIAKETLADTEFRASLRALTRAAAKRILEDLTS